MRTKVDFDKLTAELAKAIRREGQWHWRQTQPPWNEWVEVRIGPFEMNVARALRDEDCKPYWETYLGLKHDPNTYTGWRPLTELGRTRLNDRK